MFCRVCLGGWCLGFRVTIVILLLPAGRLLLLACSAVLQFVLDALLLLIASNSTACSLDSSFMWPYIAFSARVGLGTVRLLHVVSAQDQAFPLLHEPCQYLFVEAFVKTVQLYLRAVRLTRRE